MLIPRQVGPIPGSIRRPDPSNLIFPYLKNANQIIQHTSNNRDMVLSLLFYLFILPYSLLVRNSHLS